MSKQLEVAYDMLGQEMRVGSVIVAPHSLSTSIIGEIIGITPKMVRFEDILQVNGRKRGASLKYHAEVVCIDKLGPELVMAKLQQNL